MSNYQICSRCIMDTTDPEIVFDENGICNHCKEAEQLLNIEPYAANKEQKDELLNEIIMKIKNDSKKNKYDCIIGLSGGVDSSFVALKVKEAGLNPLAIHLDNGWNSELSVKNIENICKKLDIDLYTYVIDWNEFKDLQLSFLRSSTPDSEIPSDHAISAILYKMARKLKIKYILGGTNLSSESILPKAWSQGHDDWKYINSIQKEFGHYKLKTFPHRGFVRRNIDKHLIKWISFLDYYEYDKEKAKRIIENELDWKNYGRKHGESNYTKIFQEYILPNKFGFDKRKAHLSSLIIAGQIEREKAIEEIKEPLYKTSSEEREEIEYLINKLNITHVDFLKIMADIPKNIHDYPNTKDSWYYILLRRFL